MVRLWMCGFIVGAAAMAADAPAPSATFDREVLPTLQKHCQSCHRPGEGAPMSFLTYESTRPWAKAIRAAVLTRKMPPWPADSRFGHFLNDPTLTQHEIDTIAQWANDGAAEGDAKDKPAEVAWPGDWRIKPDIVISLPESPAIPAKGVLELMSVTVPSGLTKDAWITSIEIRPGDRSVVHHVLLQVKPHEGDTVYNQWDWSPTKRDSAGIARTPIKKKSRLQKVAEVEAVYVPGVGPADYRRYDAGKLIPAGSDLVIQMHYTPDGTPTRDRTRIGLTFSKEVPKRRMLTLNPTALRDAAHFHIPAGDPNWETGTEVVFNRDAEIVWLMPHMHLRGKDMEYRLRYPDGTSETLLRIKWDFGWQLGYELEKPIIVPKGSRLEVTAHFDNSANNRLNPNPAAEVRWGDQTFEEMMVPWLGVVVNKDAAPNEVVSYPREFSSRK